MQRLAWVFLVLTLAAASCARSTSDPVGEPNGEPSPTVAAFPVVVEAANGSVEIPTRPERIVSISPTGTEILFAIGAGEQVEAVDSLSYHPPEAPVTDLSAFEPSVEAISTYEPDLVVLSFDPGEVVDGLDRLGIPAILHPTAASLEDAYEQFEQLGLATGHAEEAAAVVEDMRAEFERLADSLPSFDDPVTYYLELDDTYYSVTSDTFIGQVLGLLGLESIADEAKDAASGYPQLSAEFIVDADPDLILLADTKCCGQNARKLAKRAGWDGLSAVRTGSVVELDDDVVSRWGPRVVELLRDVAEAVHGLEAAA